MIGKSDTKKEVLELAQKKVEGKMKDGKYRQETYKEGIGIYELNTIMLPYIELKPYITLNEEWKDMNKNIEDEVKNKNFQAFEVQTLM